jgi:hypothetical protein
MEHIYHIRYEYFEKDKSIREDAQYDGYYSLITSKAGDAGCPRD